MIGGVLLAVALTVLLVWGYGGRGPALRVSITSTPVQTANTSLGRVAYRTIGSGPPLVLITGYHGTMEV